VSDPRKLESPFFCVFAVDDDDDDDDDYDNDNGGGHCLRHHYQLIFPPQ
jgi:hypothetical protein